MVSVFAHKACCICYEINEEINYSIVENVGILGYWEY